MTLFDQFSAAGEPFAAGLFEFPDREPGPRYANALRRFWEATELTPYDGGMLYPCGKCTFNLEQDMAVRPHYANTYTFDRERLCAKTRQGYEAMCLEDAKVSGFPTPHTVGGAGWTHSFPNYQRILAEGVDRYRQRVQALPEGEFRDSLLITLDGIEIYRQRCLALLKEAGAPAQLIGALEYVPNHPARNAYEALVSINFIYYVDGCDDIGALDRNLLPYYAGEDLVELLREFFRHADDNDGWSGPLGPEYNDITLMCIKAIHNGRRPSLQLLVKPDMPEAVWAESVSALATSCGQPAFYNYALYRSTLHELMPMIPEADLDRLAFGGCTETMLEGISAVGSDDAGINTALVFDDWMRRGLAQCNCFEAFFEGLKEQLRLTIAQVLDILNEHRRTRALYRPSIVRTLFVDDCIDKQLDFHNNGARWVWSVINIAGLINVIDSLSVIKTLIYDDKRYTPAEFIEKLDARDPAFLLLAKSCPCYGTDDDKVDLLGAELADAIADAFDQRQCFPSGRFFPVANQFTTYADAGLHIRATPDGRCCGGPLCDSMGAIHGNDVLGPTALLNSVSKLPLNRIIGSPVTNIRLKKEHLSPLLKPLVLSFFQRGGMQLQVSCLSRDEILDAIAHPEDHRNLVVRIGGYSEYFIRLSPELQQTVLERTEH